MPWFRDVPVVVFFFALGLVLLLAVLGLGMAFWSGRITGALRGRKPVAVNVDFYSGFLYDMLGLPKELYTPLFAIARMAGWSAHRMEGLVESSKIIRPACKCIEKRRPYVPMNER